MIAIPDDNIEGIFNYCTRRCERCPFTDRCTLYQSEREYHRVHPHATWEDRVHDSFAQTFRLLQSWCEREGIDFEGLRRAAEGDEALDADMKRIDDLVRADPLGALATAYTHAALHVMDAMAPARALRRWPPAVDAALDTISWHAGMIGAKVHRALHGYAERERFADEEPVQNDWNGSAKLARIMIGESKRAWEVVMHEGEAPPDSPLLGVVSMLDRMDAAIAERFPRAMEFRRPGFDENDNGPTACAIGP